MFTDGHSCGGRAVDPIGVGDCSDDMANELRPRYDAEREVSTASRWTKAAAATLVDGESLEHAVPRVGTVIVVAEM